MDLEETGAQNIAGDLTRRMFLAANAGQPYYLDQTGKYTA